MRLFFASSCWQCAADKAEIDLFCAQCDTIQEPPSSDAAHFQLFGMSEQSFDIDERQLSQRFKQLQFRIHPDKWLNASPTEQKHAKAVSSFLNRAYTQLAVPASRAEYMLRLRGVPLDDDTATLDGEFLMSAMEVREEIDECDESDALLNLSAVVKRKVAQLTEQMTEALKSNENQTAKILALKLRYWQRAMEAIEKKME